MADRTSKPIEEIQAGDLVMRRNEYTGQTEAKPVVMNVRRHAPKVVTVTLSDATTENVTDTLTCTPEHPCNVDGKQWVAAGGLVAGDAVKALIGPSWVVKSVEWHQEESGYTVYNFEVEDDHSYFVGKYDGGVWVHNACELGQIKDAYDAVTKPHGNGPLTVIGRALAKHMVRLGSVFPLINRNPAAINEAAHNIAGEILSNPNTVRIERGNVFDIVGPDGRGMRFFSDGSFKGLLEP